MNTMTETIPAIPESTLKSIAMMGFEYEVALEYLLNQGENSITETHKHGVNDLIKQFETSKAGQVPVVKALLIIMLQYNQEEWLHARMTFHALAGIQSWGKRRGLI